MNDADKADAVVAALGGVIILRNCWGESLLLDPERLHQIHTVLREAVATDFRVTLSGLAWWRRHCRLPMIVVDMRRRIPLGFQESTSPLFRHWICQHCGFHAGC